MLCEPIVKGGAVTGCLSWPRWLADALLACCSCDWHGETWLCSRGWRGREHGGPSQVGLTCHAAIRRTCVRARHSLLGHPHQPCRKAQRLLKTPHKTEFRCRGAPVCSASCGTELDVPGSARSSVLSLRCGEGPGEPGFGIRGGLPQRLAPGRRVESSPTWRRARPVLRPSAECALSMGSHVKFKFQFAISSFLSSGGLNFFFLL